MTELTALIISIIHILVVFIGNIIFYKIGKKHGYEDSIEQISDLIEASERLKVEVDKIAPKIDRDNFTIKNDGIYFGDYKLPNVTSVETETKYGLSKATIKIANVKFTSENLTRRK